MTFEYARVQTLILELEKGYAGPTEYILYDLLSVYHKSVLLLDI
jgi:hypothetical protein